MFHAGNTGTIDDKGDTGTCPRPGLLLKYPKKKEFLV
jgi:hypothetical protein